MRIEWLRSTWKDGELLCGLGPRRAIQGEVLTAVWYCVILCKVIGLTCKKINNVIRSQPRVIDLRLRRVTSTFTYITSLDIGDFCSFPLRSLFRFPFPAMPRRLASIRIPIAYMSVAGLGA